MGTTVDTIRVAPKHSAGLSTVLYIVSDGFRWCADEFCIDDGDPAAAADVDEHEGAGEKRGADEYANRFKRRTRGDSKGVDLSISGRIATASIVRA